MPDSKVLLLVEDEVLIALGERQILEKEGYRVLHVSDGESAVEAICVQNQPVDLVLMDIHLGAGIDGIEAARQILQSRDIPLIFLSSHTEKEVVEKTEQITSYGYVVKYSGPVVLDASIKMAFKLHAARQDIQRANQQLEAEISERKRTEEILRKSESRYRGYFENATLAMFRTTREGKVIAVNTAFAKTFGYESPEEVYRCIQDVGKDVYVDPNRRQDIIRLRSMNPELTAFESLYRRKDGSAFWGRMNARTLSGTDEYPESFEGIIEDISEYKRSQEALRASEKLYRTLVETDDDAISLTDLQGNPLFRNSAYYSSLGFEVGDDAGLNVTSRIHPDDLPIIHACMAELFEKGKASLEYRIRHRAGHWLYRHNKSTLIHNEEGQPHTILSISHDITDHKKVEKILLENEARLRGMIDATPIPYALNDRQGNVTYINQAFVHTFGYTPEDLPTVEAWWPRAYPDPAYRQLVMTGWQERSDRSLRTGASFEPMEVQICCKDGSSRTVLISATPFNARSEDDLVVIFYDITDRKIAEDKVRALLYEKEMLLKEVHHRIKNNMNTITSILSLQADLQEDLATQMALQDASGRVQSMMVLYDRLYRSQNFSTVSIQEYIPALMKEVIGLFPNRDRITIEAQVEPLVLPPNLLSSIGIILNELTTNAMKYAFPDHREGQITIQAAQKGRRITIIFADNGVGLPESFSLAGSSTFGMELIQILLQQIKGSIQIDNTRGARFVIEFDAN